MIRKKPRGEPSEKGRERARKRVESRKYRVKSYINFSYSSGEKGNKLTRIDN